MRPSPHARRAQPIGLAEALRVTCQQRHHPRRKRRGEGGARGHATQPAQHVVRVHRRGADREREHDDQHAQRRHGAVHDRLERHVELAVERHRRSLCEQRQALPRDERIDRRDQQRERDGEPRGAAQLSARRVLRPR